MSPFSRSILRMRKLKVWAVEVPEVTQKGNDPLERNGSLVCRLQGPPGCPDTVLSDGGGEMQVQDSMKRA